MNGWMASKLRSSQREKEMGMGGSTVQNWRMNVHIVQSAGGALLAQ